MGEEQLPARTNLAASLQAPIREGLSQRLPHRPFLGFSLLSGLSPLCVCNRWGPGWACSQSSQQRNKRLADSMSRPETARATVSPARAGLLLRGGQNSGRYPH